MQLKGEYSRSKREGRSLAKSNDRRERIAGPRQFQRGEQIANSVLTEALVRRIRKLHDKGMGPSKIQRELYIDGVFVKYNTLRGVIYDQDRWKHVR